MSASTRQGCGRPDVAGSRVRAAPKGGARAWHEVNADRAASERRLSRTRSTDAAKGNWTRQGRGRPNVVGSRVRDAPKGWRGRGMKPTPIEPSPKDALSHTIENATVGTPTHQGRGRPDAARSRVRDTPKGRRKCGARGAVGKADAAQASSDNDGTRQPRPILAAARARWHARGEAYPWITDSMMCKMSPSKPKRPPASLRHSSTSGAGFPRSLEGEGEETMCWCLISPTGPRPPSEKLRGKPPREKK